MMDFKTHSCSKEDGLYMVQKILEFNKLQVEPMRQDEVIHITKKVTNENGELIAGIASSVYLWDCLYVDLFWIHEDYRKKGVGSKLLKEVEVEAKEKGCNLVHLDTFDFQATDFYLKNGYQIFGTLEDCPKGHKRYYLKKLL